jgi:hypothetical protein
MIKKYHYLLGILVAAVAAGMFMVLHQNKQAAYNPTMPESTTEEVQVLAMQKDSLIMLLSNAYGTLINSTVSGSKLMVTTNSANAQSANFINGNTALVTSNKEHNFTIKQNNVNGDISAEFTIKDNYVSVPSDIVFAALQKKYGATLPKK